VRWLEQAIDRANMSEPLQRSTGSIGTCSDVTRHAEEIERLIGRVAPMPANFPSAHRTAASSVRAKSAPSAMTLDLSGDSRLGSR
jgi:predicted Mrr-cat superfamily restriction endonuclease